MNLCSSIPQDRCTLQRTAKTIRWASSRPLSIHNVPSDYTWGDEFVSSNNKLCSRIIDDSSSLDLALVAEYQKMGSLRSPVILNKIVSLCAKNESIDVGVQLHSAVIKMGFSSNVYICSAVVDMYCKCCDMRSGHYLFDEMPERNVVTWNSVVSGYVKVGVSKIAIRLFLKMLEFGIAPTTFSISGILVCCSQLVAEGLGSQVHGVSLKVGLDDNVVVGTGLIDMYSKCWNVEASREVFDQMTDKNVITWTCMVTGYSQNRQPAEAFSLFKEMMRLDLAVNYMTYNSLLHSFSSPYYFDCCKQVHCRIIKEGLQSNLYLVVTLMTVYSECSCSLDEFCKVCLNITTWDEITWSALIAGLSNLGNDEEALKCFSEMRQAGVTVNVFSLASVFRAIGILSAIEEGKQSHALVFKTGYASSLVVQNGILSMYARCGSFDDSKRVFSMMEEHDVISWNSLLSGCARHGFGYEVIELFEKMRKTGVKPDETTFLTLLTACSHVGFVNKGLECFNLMRNDPMLELPRLEHYACVVDLLGRAGHLNAAEEFIDSMPIEPGPSVYKALLSACQAYGNQELALRSAKKLFEISPSDPASCVLLSNVLKTQGYWDDAADVWKLMSDRGVRKSAGSSWI